MRTEIEILLQGLATGLVDSVDRDEEALDGWFVVAAGLLEKSFVESRPHPSVSPQNLREHFRDWLPDEYLDLALTPGERGALIQALLRLLDSPPRVATEAANALIRTDAVEAVPKLVELAGRYAESEPELADRAIVAIETILGRAVDPKEPVTPERQRLYADTFAMLRRVARLPTPAGPWQPNDVARRALHSIRLNLGGSF